MIHDRDAVGHGQRLLLIVRDVDEGGAERAVQRAQLDLHLLPELEVERAERLVEEEDAGLEDERGCERDALALPAAQLGRHSGSEPLRVQPDELQRRTHPVRDLRPRPAPLLQSERDVALDREMWKQRIALEHHADLPLVRAALIHHLPEQPPASRARVGRLESGDESEERGLAATGGAEDGEKLTLADLEGHAVHGLHRAVALRYLLQLNRRGRVVSHGGITY